MWGMVATGEKLLSRCSIVGVVWIDWAKKVAKSMTDQKVLMRQMYTAQPTRIRILHRTKEGSAGRCCGASMMG